MGKQIFNGASIVSTLVVVGFVTILVLMITKPLTLDGKVADLLQTLVGVLAAKFGDVVMFHIGSSSGSKVKDGMIHDITQNQSPPKGP